MTIQLSVNETISRSRYVGRSGFNILRFIKNRLGCTNSQSDRAKGPGLVACYQN